jgi:peptidoglycan/xylan/chitin deacetylase (PgdA/CDA1 family)
MMGCSRIVNANIETIVPQLSITPSITATTTATPFMTTTNTPIIIPPTYTSTPTYTPSVTNTPLPTDTPMPTDTPIPTETPTWAWNPAGYVIAPILLYHHVSDDGSVLRYHVTLDDFRTQMEALRDWGYTSITATDLVNVIIKGGELPNRPVVITFDDGYVDVYQNAFPIMHEMGFVGSIYIYVDHVGENGFVNTEQIQALADDGWEIGNHSMSHSDLTKDHSILDFEVQQSRLTLEQATGVKVYTFAYPYGKTDDFVIEFVSDSGYLAGMGLGLRWEHTLETLFDLDRIEVQGDYDFTKFTSLLPWTDH